VDRFTAYRLTFSCQAVTPMELPRYKGSALRGAFFEALRRDFCLNKNVGSCLACPTAEVCPICKLVATVDRESPRGDEVPRPFVLEPMTSEAIRYEEGEAFSFGITLFGQALSLFPYTILAVQRMGESGLSKRAVAPGRFQLTEVWASNPLTEAKKRLYEHTNRLVSMPDVSITHQDVLRCAARLSPQQVQLDLLAPLRLVIDGKLVHELSFEALMRRLLRRLTDLDYHFCTEQLDTDFPGLLRDAAQVRVAGDRTQWLDLSSYSRRREARTPIGGLMGRITFEGDLGAFLPFLVWGQFTHVGKDTTRGNGWYQIIDSSS